MGTSGIVGPCILQAAGAGYSFKLLRTDRVAVAFFGDGAVNNGAFHEGLNLASIWKLPVLFVCENNQFATEVPFAYAAANPDVAGRGAAYNIPGVQVDGNDVEAVSHAAGEAVRRARAGQGPTLLECKTYRTRPHAEGMGDYTYRTREEVAEWRERCPIKRFRGVLVESGQATEAELDAIDAEIRDEVARASEAAENAPWPEARAATAHVYSEKTARPLPSPARAPAANSPMSLPRSRRSTTRWPPTLASSSSVRESESEVETSRTTAGLFAKYGAERLCDTPIAERGFVGMGGGAAMTGTRPIIDFMFIDFINDAFGEIINQIAKMQYMSSGRLKMPILLRGCIGIGHSAATHHSGSYHSIFSHIPGLRVVIPSTPYDAKGLFTHALRCNDPVLFLEPRELLSIKGPVPAESYEIEFGKARILREGNHVTVVGIGVMAHRALAAAARLAEEGISVEVIDPRTVSPLDTAAILASVRKTGRLLVVDEAFAPCSIASEIAAVVADAGFNDLDAPIRRLNGAFAPTPYSPTLEAAVAVSADAIAEAVRDLMSE